MRANQEPSEPVLLVCPDLRPSVLGVARALQTRGWLRGLVTGLALPQGAARACERLGMRAAVRAFRSRVVPGWLDAPVSLVWEQELLQQLARRVGASERLTHELWRWSEPAFDARVARRWAGRVPCIYGVESASVHTFEAQHRRGGLNFLWQVNAHHRTLVRIEQEQLARHPWARDGYARVRARDAAWVAAQKERQLAATDLIVCNSEFVMRSFRAAGIEPSRLCSVPTPCPTLGAAAPGEPRQRPRILLFAGQLSVRKGVPELLRAFAALGRRPDVELWLAGKNLLPERALAELPPGARLLGPLPRAELFERMREASWLVLPTLAEGRAHVVLEAAALGLPCITTHESGCTDIVADGESGLLVPAGDPAALARALRRALEEPALQARLAAEILRRARAWDAAAFERAHTHAIERYLEARAIHWPA